MRLETHDLNTQGYILLALGSRYNTMSMCGAQNIWRKRGRMVNLPFRVFLNTWKH